MAKQAKKSGMSGSSGFNMTKEEVRLMLDTRPDPEVSQSAFIILTWGRLLLDSMSFEVLWPIISTLDHYHINE